MDTDRHEERHPFARVYDAEDDDLARGFADEDPYDDPHDDDGFGCLFPGRCCMPELHFVSECHTAEMAGEMHEYAALADAGEDGPSGADPERRPRTGIPPDDGIPF